MTLLQIAAIYVASNAIVTLVLAMNVGRVRGKTKVYLGDGGDEAVLRAMRAHANNVEYVPLILLMLVVMALVPVPVLYLHIAGACLTLGRIAHGFGLSTGSGISASRVVGFFLTVIAMAVAIVALLVNAWP